MQAEQLREDIELLRERPILLNMKNISRQARPRFFSAVLSITFGVKEMLDAFVELSPPPGRARGNESDGLAGRRNIFRVSPLKSRPIWIRPTGTELPFSESVPANLPGA